MTPPTPWASFCGSSVTLAVSSPKFPGSSEKRHTLTGALVKKRLNMHQSKQEEI